MSPGGDTGRWELGTDAGSDLPSFHGTIGRSAPMQALFALIKDFAPYDISVSVLIQGETGTGTELVATAIHQLSARRRFHFGPVNCGVLKGELLLSELFGHERVHGRARPKARPPRRRRRRDGLPG